MKRIQTKENKVKLVFNILTMYPDTIKGYLDDSYIKRAIHSGEVVINIINHRDSEKNFSNLYDYPYGGGPGQIMRVDSFYKVMSGYLNKKAKTIIFSPRGKKLTQKKLFDLSKCKVINLVCPRFEGYDKRIESYCDEVISLGDFVLNGGEIPALTIVEGVTRLLSKDIKTESIEDESFGKAGDNDELEQDQYTRPEVFKDEIVPNVLLSGNHQKIKEFRNKNKQLQKDKK